MLKRLYSYIEGWRGIVLMVYLWLILMGYALLYLNVPSNETVNKLSTESLNFFYFIEVAEFLLLLTAFISPILIRFARNITVEPEEQTVSIWRNPIFWRFFFIELAILLVYYAAFYPGGFGPDTLPQYAQARSGRYSDFHPAFETIMMVTLPLKLSGGWIGAPALFHVFFAAFTIAYASYTTMKFGNKKYATCFFWYTALNPAVGIITVFIALKDMSFSFASMLMMSFVVHIYFTRGQWLKKFTHVIALAFTMTCVTIFRHNGILLTLPMLVGILFCTDRKRGRLLLLCVCALVFTVKVPLYNALNIRKPGNRNIETLGLVMTLIGDAVKFTPERIDSEVRNFVYAYAPKETWDSVNIGPGVIFGFIKHNLNGNTDIIEETKRA